MDTAVAVIAVVAVVGVFAILGQFAGALAKRLERRPADAAPPDPAVGELREQLEAVQERLDFIERMLVAQKEPGERALPRGDSRSEHEGRTPT